MKKDPPRTRLFFLDNSICTCMYPFTVLDNSICTCMKSFHSFTKLILLTGNVVRHGCLQWYHI